MGGRGGYARLALAALVLATTVPALWSRDLTGGDEVRHGDALRRLGEEGKAVVLSVNGEPYPDKPPLWFWLVGSLQRATGLSEAPAFFLASALSAVFLALATVALGRRTLDPPAPAATAGALALVATPLFLVFARTTRMDMLMAALAILAAVAFHRGLGPGKDRGATVLGFLCAGLAVLVKGPYGLLLPLGGAVLWLAWQGRLRRLLQVDVLAGLGVVGLLVGGWLYLAYALEGPEFVERLLHQQVLGRITGDGMPGKQPPWFYGALLPVVLWPWTLLLLAVPWGSVADPARRRAAFRRWWAERRVEGDGRAFLWSLIVAGLVLLSVPRTKFVQYLLPILPPACVLVGDRVLRLAPVAAQRVLAATGAGLLLLGFALPWGNLWHPYGIEVRGLLASGLTAAVGGVAVVVAAFGGPPLRALRLLAAGSAVLALVLSMAVMPSLDPVLSPRAQAELLVRAMDEGDAVLVYRVYPGTYSFHARRTVPETRTFEDVRRLLAAGRSAVLAMSRHDYDEHRADLEGVQVVDEQWIVDRTYVVLRRPAVPPRVGPR